jgi:hypothetical protein
MEGGDNEDMQWINKNVLNVSQRRRKSLIERKFVMRRCQDRLSLDAKITIEVHLDTTLGVPGSRTLWTKRCGVSKPPILSFSGHRPTNTGFWWGQADGFLHRQLHGGAFPTHIRTTQGQGLNGNTGFQLTGTILGMEMPPGSLHLELLWGKYARPREWLSKSGGLWSTLL